MKIGNITLPRTAGLAPMAGVSDRAFREIGAVDRDRTLIVGDSLTSDILGGNRAGIRTCWYDPDGAPNDTDARPDFVIRDLKQVWDLL